MDGIMSCARDIKCKKLKKIVYADILCMEDKM